MCRKAMNTVTITIKNEEDITQKIEQVTNIPFQSGVIRSICVLFILII